MDKVYYTPEMEEFHIGFAFEMINFSWKKGFFPELLSTLSELDQFQDDLTKLAHANVRVQHLHEDDFKELGMAFDVVPRALGEGKEGYIASAKIKHPRKEGVRMDIYFAQSTNWAMITFDGSCVYAGEVWNISELKKVLKRIHGDNIIQK